MYSPVRLDCMRVVPLDRKINPRYRVFIFILNFWIYLVYKVLSGFIKSNLRHVRFACAQTYLDWRTLVEKSAKILICFFWFARNGIINSWGAVFQRAIYTSPAFLKHNSAEKKMQAHAKTMIRTCRRLDFMKLLRTLYTKYIQEFKIKMKNPIARVDFPIQRHHSHADPILPDCTFMWSVR